MTGIPLITWITSAAFAGVFPYPIASHTLDNGLDVHVVTMPTPGVVAYYTWMDVGSRDEIHEGRTGFAHFFEHLMFLGTPTHPGPARERTIQRMGAEENAWTWYDETVYHVTLPKTELETWISMEADRFQNLALTDDAVRKEAGAVYGEFRKSQADPDNQLDELLWATAFTTHTYTHSTIGYEADIAVMPTGLDYARQFFDAHYRPDNATIIIAGDVTLDAVKPLIDKAYGPWKPSPPREEETRPAEPEQTELREAKLTWPSPTAARVTFGWKIPAEDPDAPITGQLQLIEDVLLSDVGPLQRRLVREEGLAYAVSGGRYSCVDACLFTVSLTLKDPSHGPKAEAIVREEIRKLQQVEPKVLDAARSHAKYGVLTSLARPGDVAGLLGWKMRRGRTPDSVDRYYDTYESVTAEQLAEAARTTFVDSGLTIVRLVAEPTP